MSDTTKNWEAGSMTELIGHLLQHHHPYTKATLEELSPLMKKVLSVHGAEHPELAELAALLRDYAGQYICLQAGHVIAHGADPIHGMTRRDLAGAHKEQAVWFKYVDPDDFEDERFEVYERELAALAGRSSDGRPRGSVRVCGCASE